jgi:PAS domain S-box-containing protein
VSESIRVLHVDDDPEFIDLTAEFIDREYETFDISRATDAAEGLEKLQTEPIDCVVCDYKLPGMDGIELLETVRKESPGLPFILFTGKGSEAVASEAISAGATDYFRKERIEDQYELLANRIENAVTATTNRQRAESQEQEYRTLVEQAPVPMVVVTADAEISYCNEVAVETLAGDTPADIVGRDIETFLPAETLEEIRPRLRRVLEEREPVGTREVEFVDLDGVVRHARGTIVPVTFDGEPAAQAVVSDITERKAHRQQLEEQREQITRLHGVGVELASCDSPEEIYDLIVETAEHILDLDLCVVGIEEDGRFTLAVSSTDMNADGYIEPEIDSPEAGLAGKAYRNNESFLYGDLSRVDDANPVQEYRSALVVPLGEFGTFQAVSYEIDAFSETEMELVEILVGHAREALVRLEQEQQLREQRDRLQRENERLNEFASIISHDLRNPLNVAQLRLDLAMDDSDSDHLDSVARAVDRMETLTDELLELARQGDEITETEPVDLDSVATQCWGTVETGPATLTTETDGVLRADRSRLQQLLENLIRNAIEHGCEDVSITVGRFEDGFYVEDDGVGMAEEVAERAFESGFSTSDNGTGFGLAIVARVAEAHGWAVTATESDSGGARFEFAGVEFVS